MNRPLIRAGMIVATPDNPYPGDVVSRIVGFDSKVVELFRPFPGSITEHRILYSIKDINPLCELCGNTYTQHANGQCLFSSMRFKPWMDD